MHIVLINQFYPPASAPTGVLLADLARTLHQRGHRVTVVTSPAGYDDRPDVPSRPPSTAGITVCRTGPDRRHRTSLMAKLADYTRFFRNASRVLEQLSPSPDVVLSMTTPPFSGLIANRLKNKRGIPYVLWCMDLYPEALEASRWIRRHGPISGILEGYARRERHGAAAVITLAPDMSALVRSSAPETRIIEVPVWSRLQPSAAALAAAAALRRERGWASEDFILMYSGHMGRAHSIARFAQLALQAKASASRIRFVFCGSGPATAKWKIAGGVSCEWLAPVGADSIAAHLLAADIHLISQQQDWAGVVVPSKYQAACALARPVLFDGPADSAVAQWIREGDTGWTLTESDADAPAPLLAALQNRAQVDAKGNKAYDQRRRLFDTDRNAVRIAETIEQSLYPHE